MDRCAGAGGSRSKGSTLERGSVQAPGKPAPAPTTAPNQFLANGYDCTSIRNELYSGLLYCSNYHRTTFS